MAFVAPLEELPVELSIIIVSYNTKALTLEALASLFRHPPPVNFEVILLDNASPDASGEAIAKAFPQIDTILHPVNAGFAKANNIAAEKARGRRILLLNPDTVTLEKSHAGHWAFAEREPERGIWGGRTLFPDLTLNPTSCWRRMTLWSLFCSALGLTHMFPKSRLFSSEAYGDWKRDSIADVDIVTGCFLLVDTALWRRLGGFDEAFFMYAEEADLCLRAAASGANPGISPEAEIVHMGGVSESELRLSTVADHLSAHPRQLAEKINAARFQVAAMHVNNAVDLPEVDRAMTIMITFIEPLAKGSKTAQA